MRLLHIEGLFKVSLVEFYSDIPPYAILSHTWGPDDQEVTYLDVAHGRVKIGGVEGRALKAGYKKLQFCYNQAQKDGVEYFWMDTCCIDKSSSAELSEAINSMFRWYQDAAHCYVYLDDVTFIHGEPQTYLRMTRFKESRWFKRGWTLQELLAPSVVKFFSENGFFLGTKISLHREISSITRIPIPVLIGRIGFPEIEVEERFSWAETRRTKRSEDAAYCLFGLFDVHMPLIYGEGEAKALRRLKREINESLKDQAPPTHTAESLASLDREMTSSMDGVTLDGSREIPPAPEGGSERGLQMFGESFMDMYYKSLTKTRVPKRHEDLYDEDSTFSFEFEGRPVRFAIGREKIRARVLVEDDPADPYSLSGSKVWTSDIHIERSGSNIILLIFGEIMLKRNMPSAQNPRKRFVQNLVLAKREYNADQTFEEYYILNDVFRFPRTTLSERSLVLRARNEDTELTR